MYFLVCIIAGIITSIVYDVLVYRRHAHGEMDVEWDSENGIWNATMHIPATIDYSKTKKLILKINKKKHSRN